MNEIYVYLADRTQQGEEKTRRARRLRAEGDGYYDAWRGYEPAPTDPFYESAYYDGYDAGYDEFGPPR